MDIIANNLANLSTSGFKSERPVFEDYVMPLATADDESGAAAEIHYVHDTALFRDFVEGPQKTTGNPLDLSINGKGWFVLEGEEGELYTRNGHFRLDPEGRVVAASGDPLLTENGPIVLAPGETGLHVAEDGTVTTSLGAKGRLQVVRFENEPLLEKRESGVFAATPDQNPEPAENFRVSQGILEGSNVNAIQEITSMIQVTRAYTTAARTLEDANTLRQSAIEKLGQAPN